MFTGIIEEIGKIDFVLQHSRSCRLSIRCFHILEGTKLGDSIAVNGACLTVAELRSDGIVCDVTPETMRRTAFSELHTDSSVNLERALRLNDRLGGHIVLGHVDTVGHIASKKKEGNAVNISVTVDSRWEPYILEKGSVSIDGISLTVAKKTGHMYTISVIPHTGQETTLFSKPIGAPVNIECDYLGKYVKSIIESQHKDTGEIKLSIDNLKNW